MKRVSIVLAVLVPGFAFVCTGELQNVQAGGAIQIYASWYSAFFQEEAERIPEVFLSRRPVGRDGAWSFIRADGKGNSISTVEQRTRVFVTADFTGGVRAFIEFDIIRRWGDDFRSDYITGADAASVGSGHVEVFQSYIETDGMLGMPLRLRIGRQEMLFGSGWLVGPNPEPEPFTGLSFDAVRLTWLPGDFIIDAWWSKLADRSPLEQDGDVDFYGLYSAYAGIDGMEFDAYWLLVRDARRISDTRLPWFGEWIENVLGLDDYGPTSLHTVGARWAGECGGIDWELEAAYQFGKARALGAEFPLPFRPLGLAYGDDSAKWGAWGGRIEVGYTFDTAWEPRLYVGAQYYSGEDNRSISFREWLNPFHTPRASVSFNRLFSDFKLDSFLDESALSNFWMAAAGVSSIPAETFEVGLDLAYYEIVEPFAWPVFVTLGRWRMLSAPELPFLDRTGAKDLGWQATLWASYAYSDDLTFEIGWTRFFVGDGLRDGGFIDSNGLGFVSSQGAQDADYVWFLTTISF